MIVDIDMSFFSNLFGRKTKEATQRKSSSITSTRRYSSPRAMEVDVPDYDPPARSSSSYYDGGSSSYSSSSYDSGSSYSSSDNSSSSCSSSDSGGGGGGGCD